MSGKPNGNSLEGRLLEGLTYADRSDGTGGIVYTSRPEHFSVGGWEQNFGSNG